MTTNQLWDCSKMTSQARERFCDDATFNKPLYWEEEGGKYIKMSFMKDPKPLTSTFKESQI